MDCLLDINERLLNKWESISKEKEPNTNFVKDGLLNRGDIYYNGGNWDRHPCKCKEEEYLWKKSPIKVVFLMKDYTNESMGDIRYETLRRNGISPLNDPIKRDCFSMNILYWLYGLTHVNGTIMVPFSEIENGRICFDFYERYPLVRLNCKKVSGKSSISNSLLYQYLSDPDYSKFLKEQIELFDSDIIVCCGGNSQIKKFVTDNIYKDCKKINNWMFYSSEKEKLIINSYHPSYYRCSRQSLYEELMKNYLEFLSTNDCFSKKMELFKEFEKNELQSLKYNIII